MYPSTRRNYTDEFKTQAVALAESVGRTEAARQLEMSVKALDNWVDASRRGQPLSSPERKPITKEDSELARMRAEVAELKMEREILKRRRYSSPESPSEIRLRRR
ncbi:transposase [Pseudomonas syringae]|uniref:transposase n=1 Tax=Pseudomonas syringae TaxID=317 RepID=UPI001F315CB6|nr:transposase [Pseudomonas syringae]MCF5653167.1 transposase [Pseudomonas syringae]